MELKQLIEELIDQHPYKEAGNADSYSDYNQGWSDALGVLEGRLEELPPPQPVTEDDMSGLILEWQKHNRDNGLSWNEVAELGRQIFSRLQPQIISEGEIDALWWKYKTFDVDSMSKRNFKNVITALQGKEQRGEEWISVEDRLPEVKEYGSPDLMVSDRVLCLTNTGLNAVGFLNNGVWIHDAKHNDFKRLGYSVTHWQQLPPPPKKQGDNGKEGEG